MTTTIINQTATTSNSFSRFVTHLSSKVQHLLKFDLSLDLDKHLMEEITMELTQRND